MLIILIMLYIISIVFILQLEICAFWPPSPSSSFLQPLP